MAQPMRSHILLAERAFAAGQWRDAQAQYVRALEEEPDDAGAVYGLYLARGWDSSLYSGKITEAITGVKQALALCGQTERPALLERAAVDLINLSSGKYNELTQIYASIAKGESGLAPTRLFAYTWAAERPQGLTLADVYIPMINYLAGIIAVGEYLEGLLAPEPALAGRRELNLSNLVLFYDWMLAFQATGRLCPEYREQTAAKRERCGATLRQMEQPPAGEEKKKRRFGIFRRGR